MSKNREQDEFHKSYPYPDEVGIKSLFRFYKIDKNNYLSDLLVDNKLYHSTPDKLNDPFECKPHFNWPSNPKKVKEIRKHLIGVFTDRGKSRKEAEALVSNTMKQQGLTHDLINKASLNAYTDARICSFANNKDNLLLWSHYADSYKGFCIEFDASKLPISMAFKVQYREEYPEAVFPPRYDERMFIPILTKSKIWEYEGEFRTIFVPEATQQYKNDGESLILKGDEIKNIYLGAKIKENNKAHVLELIENGPFDPEIWLTSLSNLSFRLNFDKF